MKKIKIYLSILICFTLLVLLSVYFVSPVRAAEKDLKVFLNGEIAEEIQIKQDEKLKLTTLTEYMDDASFQWQIMQNTEEAVWVDIYDKTEDDCEISYALVKSMLDYADSVYIRCTAMSEGKPVCSNEVCVTVQPGEEYTGEVATYAQVADYGQGVSVQEVSEEQEYVTVTIKYLDVACFGENATEETAIYSPYVATIEKGSKFVQNVVSPTFLGFAPYCWDETASQWKEASIVELNYETVSENQVIYVYYRPIEVNYAVKYFFQNINDDLYMEDVGRYQTSKAETGTIITNERLEEMAGETIGFTKMYHIPESVAADGSTVFECYYDRNYYLVEFDLNGGYGVEPIYARYDAAFAVNEPIRHGYNFKGWTLVAVDMDEDGNWDQNLPEGISTELVSNIPSYNCCYQAKWERIDTTYTVVYWLESEKSGTKYLTSKTQEAKSGDVVSGGDTVELSEKRYYTYERADSQVMVEGDGSTVVNVYYKPKVYTLRFYYAATTGDTVKIIGGSTYIFGKDGTNTTNVVTLLDNTFNAQDRAGTVKALPELNEEGKRRDYGKGTVTSQTTNMVYHYIEFQAEYGQNISELWPCSVFESAERTEVLSNTNGWSKTKAFVAGWNGEHHVAYSQNNTNQTIKGKYEKLDANLLFDSAKFADASVVSYLCFWENGAGKTTWNIPKLFVYRIWVPVLPEDLQNAGDTQTVDGLPVKISDGVTYKLIDVYDTCDNSDIDGQTIPSLEGYTNVKKVESTSEIIFTEEQKASYQSCHGVDFYYTRNKHELDMKNYDEYIIQIDEEYGHKISDLKEVQQLGDGFVPAYPKTLEKGAYEFEGWYTTEQCLDGTKVNLATYRMPDASVLLYANWIPKKHTVHFFTTYDNMKKFEEGTLEDTYRTDSVAHGNVVGSVETPVQNAEGNMNLIFAGWFYMEAGQKKAFSPLNIPVNKDLNLFAEWSSHSPQPYRIRYVEKGNPDVEVAEETVGYAYGGSTRTFYAKAGNPYHQLYEEYNKGWFPTVSSHSITIQAEADKDHLKRNMYTFYYVKADKIAYTVRYVNKADNTVLKTERKETTDAVVTERFVAFENMVPDAFYKRLVLEVEEDKNNPGTYVGTDNNVITFYYTPNETSAFYAVHYMLEKPGATEEQKSQYHIDGTGGYEEATTHEESVGQIGHIVYIQPQSVSGFELIENTSVPIVKDSTGENLAPKEESKGYAITITRDGTELYLFYRRNQYPYKVHYYRYNTTIPIASSEEGNAPYGSEVMKEAKSISGMTCVSEKTQSIVIREDAEGTKGLNVIIFYYAPLQYVVEYEAVPKEGGNLSNTIEVKEGTDEFSGSVPTADKYYRFEGWYLDKECTQSAETAGTIDSETKKFVPDKGKLSETGRNIFYAKFERKVGDFTIGRQGALDTAQVFIYEVRNDDTGEVIEVTITGNGSVTIANLPFGKYTVTQQNNWSWRYQDLTQSATHTSEVGTSCSFGEEEANDKWLNGNSSVLKNQRGQTR